MLEIAGRPLIEAIVRAIELCGIRSVTVITGYRAPIIERHLAATSPLPVSFVRQAEPNGTAAAVVLARSAVGEEPFLLCWGDIATAPDHFGQVVDAWRPELAAVVGVNRLGDVGGHASVVFDAGRRISRIVEKPVGTPPSLWNNSGLMILSARVWPHVDRIRHSQRGELELPDAINRLIAAGEVLEAVPLDGRWFDIGTAESLEAARQSFGADPAGPSSPGDYG